MDSSEFGFGKFSKNDFYGTINERLIDMAELGSNQKIIELACATGGVTKLILDRLKDAKESVVIAIDHSASALKQAMKEINGRGDSIVEFVQSQVEQIPETIKGSAADVVIFCNAIHYISDKNVLATDIFNALKPGGKFVFNTSFYDGGQPEDSLLFYRKWMFKSLRALRKDYQLRPDASKKVESRKQLNPTEYTEILESNGFQVVQQIEDRVQVPIDGWLDISEFEDFIQGTMPGVDMQAASNSLKKGVHAAFEEMKVSTIPRNWMRVVAVKV